MNDRLPVVVTGGSGRLGAATLRRIIGSAAGRRVISLDIAPTSPFLGVEQHCTDLCAMTPATVAALHSVGPCDLVLLSARIAVDPMPWAELDALVAANAAAQLHTLEALSEQVRRVVVASSVEVYGEPLGTPTPFHENQQLAPVTAYGITKMLGECTVRTWCERANVLLTVLRFTSLYGPAEPLPKAATDFLRTAVNGGQIRLRGDGSSLRDYLYLDDAADAVIAALQTEGGGVFNIAHPEKASLTSLAETAIRMAGKGSIAYEQPDAPRRDRVMDVGRMLHVLRFEPRVGIADGLLRVLSCES